MKSEFINDGERLHYRIADILKEYALDHNVSQRALSEASNITQGQISRIFTHTSLPTFTTLCALSEAMDLEFYDVVREALKSNT